MKNRNLNVSDLASNGGEALIRLISMIKHYTRPNKITAYIKK
jgi:hypothetical protein